MSKWVQANTSILSSKTCCNCSFSSSDERELTYVCLSGQPRSIDSRGSLANCSLSSISARAVNCDCYSRDCVSRPDSRSDPIGESEPVSGCETIYWDSLLVFFFFRAELIPVGILTIFVITKHHLHIQRNYHRSGIH